jgi:glycosyltransferase involved in cell wall biosynthesis
MAVRNGEPFIEEAVQSVLVQTYRELQLLVVDDGSTDGTAAGVERQAGDDARLRLVSNGGEPGLAGALAFGFDAVSTEYVARLDADDLAIAERFERQIAYLDQNPLVGLLGSACCVFDSNGDRGVWSSPIAPLAVRWRSLLANPFLHSTVVVRRAVLADAGLNYDPGLQAAQDYDLWTRALVHTEGSNLEAALVRYRLHPDQTTVRRRDDQLRVHDRIAVRTIAAELPNAAVDESDVRDLRALFHGGGDVPADPLATATLYLDLLDAFLARRASTGSQRAQLERDEAQRVLGVLSRTDNVTRGRRLIVRLLRLDPTLPLHAAVAAASRTRLRPNR